MDLELGNLMFNCNNNQSYECPKYVIALLDAIDKELNRIQFNLNQKNWDSPFSNTGNTFKLNKVFEVQAYNWESDKPQEYNFIYYNKDKNIGNIKISWYKYLGRDTTINKEFTPEIIISMFDDIIERLRKYEKKELKKLGIVY